MAMAVSSAINIVFRIGPWHDLVTWHGINYAGTQITSGTSKTKESQAGLVRVPLFSKSHCVIYIGK